MMGSKWSRLQFRLAYGVHLRLSWELGCTCLATELVILCEYISSNRGFFSHAFHRTVYKRELETLTHQFIGDEIVGLISSIFQNEQSS